jgi:tRNA threonylcarbamoyladenosine biosynthesis protein TsaE
MTSDSTTISTSVDETQALGRRLGERLAAGSVVLLYGDLGVGKTAFVRGLAEGLGADPDEVSSPTFTIVQEYRGRLPLYHADLYRLQAGPETEDLGLEELVTLGGVLAIEWAERFGGAGEDAVRVRIEDLGEDLRRITIAGDDHSTR